MSQYMYVSDMDKTKKENNMEERIQNQINFFR